MATPSEFSGGTQLVCFELAEHKQYLDVTLVVPCGYGSTFLSFEAALSDLRVRSLAWSVPCEF